MLLPYMIEWVQAEVAKPKWGPFADNSSMHLRSLAAFATLTSQYRIHPEYTQ